MICKNCGSNWVRELHEDDKKNCDCEGPCLVICAEEGCL
jgi:hypothetical protein